MNFVPNSQGYKKYSDDEDIHRYNDEESLESATVGCNGPYYDVLPLDTSLCTWSD